MVHCHANYNLAELKDKIHACWVGKNIGGTIGGPFEGSKEFLDVQGYTTEKGEPLPNDDLDLQLVWLVALEEYGPYQINANVLGEYWLKFIPPEWNEYGTGKANMRMGLYPPFSGEYCNEAWKNSNGAWIRSEVWACLAPGYPEVALRYAQMDASVDHGMSEGTYAEWFTAALDSLAFRGGNIREIIEKALSFIPADCRVAKSVRIVLDSYDKGLPYRETRELLVKDSEDLGWFQAPANIGYVTIGLMYGEGDFKNSILRAVNCGDDTDCTAATVGAFLGILNGMAGIPEDWSEYIGDKIVTKAIDGSCWVAPKTCEEFTNRIIDMIPIVMQANSVRATLTDAPTEINYGREWKSPADYGFEWYVPDRIKRELSYYKPYSYFAAETVYAKMYVAYDACPTLTEGGEVKASIIVENMFWNPANFYFNVFCPEGFTVAYNKTAYCSHGSKDRETGNAICNLTIKAETGIQPLNKIYVEVTSPGKLNSAVVPIIVLG